jgi:hypothetical protein
MSDWLSDVIDDHFIAIYESHYFTEDAVVWLREKPRTLASCAQKRSIGCGGWLQTSMTWICCGSCHRILILKTAVWAGSEVAGICTVDLANAALSDPATRPTQRQARTLFWASIDLTFAVPSL